MGYLYALISKKIVKKIAVDDDLVSDLTANFLNAASILKPEGIEEDVFTGDILARKGENIVYVNFNLPDEFNNIPDNQADIPDMDMKDEVPTCIFWYDNGKFLFQAFNKRNILDRKIVAKIFNGKTYGRLKDNAFIIDDKIQAIYDNGKLFFQSYNSANLIFDLIEYVKEATDSEIDSFGTTANIVIDIEKVKKIATVKTRRLISLLSKSDNIQKFAVKKVATKKSLLKKYNVDASLSEDGDIVIPDNDSARLNRTLEFLNEDIFSGAITNRHYRTNSKKVD